MFSALLAATLFFAGDSTLDDNGFKHPYRSWGRESAFYLKSGHSISNFAVSGASTRSFKSSGRWASLSKCIKKGDYVIIQFGHNDQKRATKWQLETRWSDPDTVF